MGRRFHSVVSGTTRWQHLFGAIRIDRAERERDQTNQQTQSHQLDRWYTKTGGQTGPNGRLYWSNQGNTTRFGTERRDLNAQNACIADKWVLSVSSWCLRTQKKMEQRCTRAKRVAKRGTKGWKTSIWCKTAVSRSKRRHPGDRRGGWARAEAGGLGGTERWRCRTTLGQSKNTTPHMKWTLFDPHFFR